MLCEVCKGAMALYVVGNIATCGPCSEKTQEPSPDARQ